MTNYLSINITADNDEQALIEVKKAITGLQNLAASLEVKVHSVQGVCWDKHNQKWRARFFNCGRIVNIGSFCSFEEAALALQNARSKGAK